MKYLKRKILKEINKQPLWKKERKQNERKKEALEGRKEKRF